VWIIIILILILIGIIEPKACLLLIILIWLIPEDEEVEDECYQDYAEGRKEYLKKNKKKKASNSRFSK